MAIIALAMAVAPILSQAQGANLIWDGGGGSGTWATGTNWQLAPGGTDQAPVGGDSLYYTSTSNLLFTQTNDLPALTSINGIRFGVVPPSGTGTANVGGFNISGNGITLTGDIENYSTNSTGTQTFNMGIDLSGVQRMFNASATPSLSNGGNTADLTFNGVISGSSNLLLTGDGNGQIRLLGSASNSHNGTSIVANGTTFLGKTGGAVAIVGPVQMGNANTNQPNLRMLANEQFGPGVEMTFSNASGNWARFDLQGTTQTLAGLSAGTISTQAGAVIQNERISGGGTTADATLKLNGSGTYVYNGYLRNEDDGGNTYKLSLVKEGTGTQTFAGSQITHTGGTTINGGEINLASANVGRGIWTINNGGILRGSATDSINFIQTTVVNAGGKIIQSGGSYQQFYNGNLGGTVLELNGGRVEATVAAHGNYGNFLLRGNVLVGGTQTSVISADFRMGDNADRTFTVNQTGDPSGIDLDITGNFSHFNNVTWGYMTKTGPGTIRFTATSTNQVGRLTNNQGKVLFVDQMNGWGNGGINNNAAFEANMGASVFRSYAQALIGTGNFTKSGTGRLSFNGGSQVIRQGQFFVTAGTLQNDNNSVNWSTNTGDMDISSGAILDLYADPIHVDSLTGSGIVQNNYGNSSGFSGSGQYIEKLVLGVDNGTATFTGTIRNNATNASLAAGVGGGGLSLVKEGTGTQTLSGSNITYSGTTTVNQGTLSLQMAGSGVTFNSNISIASGATLDLTTTNASVDNWRLDTPVTGVAGSTITKNGAGWVKVQNSGGLAGFHGNLIINNGIFGNGFNFVGDWTGSTADVAINNPGVLDLRTDNITIDTLSGNGTVGNTFNADGTNTLTIGTGNGNATFSGIIRGAGGGANNSSQDAGRIALVKTGTGVQELTGANTYAGGTTVQNGTLLVNNTTGSGLGSGLVTIQAGGTIGGSGSFSTAGLTVQTGGTLAPGNSPGVMTVTSPLTLSPGSIFELDLAIGGSSAPGDGTNGTDLLIVNGPGPVTVTNAVLLGNWGGNLSNIFTGTLGADNMFWVMQNNTPGGISGLFSNTIASPGLTGLFGTTAYSVSVGGMSFAAFYSSQYGVTNASGLTGGNDLLLVAIPEPSRALLALLALLPLALRRNRK